MVAAALRPAEAAPGDPRILTVAIVVVLLITIALLAPMVLLARRNLQSGRGDLRGALRIAVVASLALMAAQFLRADHTSDILAEYSLLALILAQGAYGAVLLWSFYVALEPVVRRRWPRALISWSRLLAGRLGDPLVGRDVLVGILAGLAVVLTARLAALLAPHFGRPPIAPIVFPSALSDSRHVLYAVVRDVAFAPAYAMAALLTFTISYAVVRRAWLAALVLGLVIVLPFTVEIEDAALGAVVGAVFAGIIVTVLVRFGLLAQTLLWFTFGVLLRVPLTLDARAWYAGRSSAVLLLFALLLTVAAYTSLGGKPLFGRALLED